MTRRKKLLLVLFVCSVCAWGAYQFRQRGSVERLRADCRRLEESGDWAGLLDAAQSLLDVSSGDREGVLAGSRAARHLGRPLIVAGFLEQLDHDDPRNIEHVSMLADLQFGPLNEPRAGAETCRSIIELSPAHAESQQRLIYYYAMTQQHASLLHQIRSSAENSAEPAEAFVYSLLAENLRLSNGMVVTEQWLRANPRDELLSVANLLHQARAMSGAIPSVDEQSAQQIREAQERIPEVMEQASDEFPENLELLAYRLGSAVESGDIVRVGELLEQSPPGADRDNRFWRARGWLFARLDDFDEALRSFERAMELNPMEWKARYHLADVYRRRGDFVAAESQHHISETGRNLESEILTQPDSSTIPVALLQRLLDYAEACEDGLAAERLGERIRMERSGGSL